MSGLPVGSRRLALRANMHVVDYGILALALTSLLVFLLDRTRALPQLEARALMGIDIGLALLYATMFAVKLAISLEPGRWLKSNAIYAFGALPITINLLVPDRYFIVVQTIVVILRVGEGLDRAFGQRVLQGIFDRYRSMLVEELTTPLLMRLTIVLEEAVTSRDYAAAIGKRLDERRDLVEQAVKRGISASPKLARISSFGPVERWIDETTHEVVDAAHAALTGPEVNTVIRESLQELFVELKQGIAQKEWRGKGVGVLDVASGVVRVR